VRKSQSFVYCEGHYSVVHFDGHDQKLLYR
jgi:hypothetical protein